MTTIRPTLAPLLLLGPTLLYGQGSNIGPINTPRINTVYYAGTTLYPTIQSAVTAACSLVMGGTVVRNFGVTTNDTPGNAIGCTSVSIVDGSAVLPTYYTWQNGFYVVTAQGFGSLAVGAGGLTVAGTSALSGATTVGTNSTPAGIQVYGNGVVTGTFQAGASVALAGATTVGTSGSPASLQVYGNGVVTGTFQAGATQVGTAGSNANLNVYGNQTVSGTLASGASTASSYTATGPFTAPYFVMSGATGPFSTIGSSGTPSGLSVYGSLNQAGASGQFNAAGTATLAGATTVGTSQNPSSLTVYGNSALNGTLSLSGSATAPSFNAQTGFLVGGTALASTNLSDSGQLARLGSNITGTAAGISTAFNPNYVLAGPASGSSGAAPTARALVAADIPSGLPYLGTGGGNLTGALTLSGNTVPSLAMFGCGTATSISGTPSASTYLAGNCTWSTPAGSGGSNVPAATGANQFAVSGASSPYSYGARTLVSADIPANAASTTGTAAGISTAFSANTVLAGPSSGSSSAAPTARALVAADIPALAYLPLTGGTITGTGVGAFKVGGSSGFTVNPAQGCFGIGTGPTYAFCTSTPLPSGFAGWGGFFNGMQLQGSSNNTNTPIFGVGTSTQGGVGLNGLSMTIYDTNKVVTYNNTLDDGSGNSITKGSQTVNGTSTLNASQTVNGNQSFSSTATATSSNNYNSFLLQLLGSYWNGSAAAQDLWSIQDVLGTGTNPTTTLILNHGSGTSGAAFVQVPGLNTNGGGTLAGTFGGSPTWTGNPTFTGTPNFTGSPTFGANPSFAGNPSFTGTPTFGSSAQTNISSGGVITSSVAAYLSGGVNLSSTVPTGNLAVSRLFQGPVYNAGGTVQQTPHSVIGTTTLSSSTSATITLSGSAVFSSTTSYSCSATDESTIQAVAASPASGSSFSLHVVNSGSDSIAWICIGT